jgi:hypothetical protein
MTQKKYTDKELIEWLTGKARTAAGFRRKILSNTERSKDTTVIGRMFFFKYDPKWKDILPIYDKFPMVFPIESYSDGFLGLNLHYLDYGQRLYLINQLSKFASNKKLTPSTRLKLSYDLLQSSKILNSLARPCIKRYLYSHVRSKFIEITPDEWDKAASLPVEMFVTKK